MKSDFFGFILIGFVIAVCIKMFFDSDYYNLSCIISTVDGNKYCVRIKEDLNHQETVDLLARVTNKCKRVVNYMKEKYNDRENVKRLVENFNPKSVKEILPTSQYTAYSENKGEKLAFCTTTKKDGGSMIDENTLTFVALHELSHIMTKSIGHTDEFWDNFKLIIKTAIKHKLYTYRDYYNNPVEYCGININSSPYIKGGNSNDNIKYIIYIISFIFILFIFYLITKYISNAASNAASNNEATFPKYPVEHNNSNEPYDDPETRI